MKTNSMDTIKYVRTKKMMLWFGMISMAMTFAGLTSAYLVSSKRADWITQIELPQAFIFSTLIMVLSSVTFLFAKRMLLKGNNSISNALLGITLLLSFLFIYFQFQGFQAIINQGYYFTGAESSITTSYLYVLVLLHLAHLFAGLIVVSVILYKNLKGRYSKETILGFDLGLTFWHFLDFLWLYLFLFVSLYH